MTSSSSGPLSCEECLDTGVRGQFSWDELCDCEAGQAERRRRRKLHRERQARAASQLFRQAGVPPEFRGLTISSLEKKGVRGKRRAIAAAKRFLEEFEGDRRQSSLLVSGWYGVGKTGLLSAIYQELVRRGVAPAIWIEANDFYGSVQAAYSGGSSHELMERAQQARLLMIDDLGTTRLLSKQKGTPQQEWSSRAETDDKQRLLDMLVSHRHRERLPILVTTNLTLNQLTQQYDGRVTERLLQMSECVEMAGQNLRMA